MAIAVGFVQSKLHPLYLTRPVEAALRAYSMIAIGGLACVESPVLAYEGTVPVSKDTFGAFVIYRLSCRYAPKGCLHPYALTLGLYGAGYVNDAGYVKEAFV